MSNNIQLLTPVDFSGGASGKEPTYQCRRQKILAQSLSGEDTLEEGMATQVPYSCFRIPWTEEPGRLQSTGSHRVRHKWSNLARMCLSLDGYHFYNR